MQTYSQQLRAVKRFKVPEGVSRRFDCPFCNGKNTLGVSNLNGKLEWHCFKASCEARGIYNEGSSLVGIAKRLSDTDDKKSVSGRPIPDLLIAIREPEHIEWLKYVHAWQAYEEGLAPIFYSPSEDRILFSIGNGKGYTGRTLGTWGPKWVKYGDTTHLFTCGHGRIGVIVEDAPSACAVGVLPEYTGIALLGTVLTSQQKLELLNYEKLYVCLDPDAAIKSILIASSLDGIRPTIPKVIQDDLKYFQPEQIKEMLND